jgi:hypothetical protein
MSDDATTEPTTPETTSEPTAAETTPDLGDGGKKALDAERKARREAEKAKALLEAKVKEFEDSQKSELEKAAARAEAAEKAAAEASARALRLEVAAETGLPADLHEFLTGSDEESLRAQAEKLKAATAAGRTTPRPDPTQGAKPAAADGQLTRVDLASMSPEQINQALEAGRLRDVLAGKA